MFPNLNDPADPAVTEAHPDRPGAVLEDAASMLAGQLFAGGATL